MKNRLQIVSDHLNQELAPKFLACPGFDEITIIRNTNPVVEYKLSYAEDDQLAFCCTYEVFNDKIENHMHMARDLDLEPIFKIARAYAKVK